MTYGPSGEGSARHAAGDHLRERREVGRDADQRLCPTRRPAEARHDLVEHDERPLGPRGRCDGRHARGREWHRSPGRAGRLENHAGHVSARELGLERSLGERIDDGEVRIRRRSHRCRRIHGQRDAWACVVVPAMEMAGELEYAVAPGEPARDAQREQRRLGAAGREAHALGTRHERHDALRPIGLELAARTEVHAEPGLPPHRLDDRGMRVPGDERAVAHHVVQEAMPVEIPLVGALGVRDARRERVLASGVVGEPAREQRQRALVGGLRSRIGARIFGERRERGAHPANATSGPARV